MNWFYVDKMEQINELEDNSDMFCCFINTLDALIVVVMVNDNQKTSFKGRECNNLP